MRSCAAVHSIGCTVTISLQQADGYGFMRTATQLTTCYGFLGTPACLVSWLTAQPAGPGCATWERDNGIRVGGQRTRGGEGLRQHLLLRQPRHVHLVLGDRQPLEVDHPPHLIGAVHQGLRSPPRPPVRQRRSLGRAAEAVSQAIGA